MFWTNVDPAPAIEPDAQVNPPLDPAAADVVELVLPGFALELQAANNSAAPPTTTSR